MLLPCLMWRKIEMEFVLEFSLKIYLTLRHLRRSVCDHYVQPRDIYEKNPPKMFLATNIDYLVSEFIV